jgi:hypothetical protein
MNHTVTFNRSVGALANQHVRTEIRENTTCEEADAWATSVYSDFGADSYMIHDELGRLVEVGPVPPATP